MDFFALSAAAFLCRKEAKKRRLAAGGLVAALTSVLITFNVPSSAPVSFAELAVSLVLAALAAFCPVGAKEFAKLCFAALAFSIAAGGVTTALYNLAGFASLWVFAFSSAAAYVTLIFLRRNLRKGIRKEKSITSAEVSNDGESISLKALVDTGHALKDPITGASVIIAEFEAIAPCLPENARKIFFGGKQGDLAEILALTDQTPFASKIRLLPFRSVGEAGGILVGFRPDGVKVGERAVRAVVGIYGEKLDSNGEYNALIPPELVK